MEEFFKFKDVLVTLLEVADHQTLTKLYDYYRIDLDDPRILKRLAMIHKIPWVTTTYEKGIPKRSQVIESFYDLIFEMELRDPVARKTSCLKRQQMMKIAVKEQDVALVRSLLNESSFRDHFGIGKQMGRTGNRELINLVDKKIDFQTGILVGLVEGHHNDLFDEEALRNPQAMLLSGVIRGTVVGDNLEIYQRFYKKGPNSIMCYYNLAGFYNSQQIIRFMKSQVVFDDEMNASLFVSLLTRGHLLEAKELFKEIIDKSLIGDLAYAIGSGSIETLIYAEKLQKDLTGQGFQEAEIEEALIERPKVNDSLIYFLDAHPKWIQWYLDNVLIAQSRSLKDFIKFFNHFDPSFLLAEWTIQKMEKLPKSDQCAIKWLRNKVMMKK